MRRPKRKTRRTLKALGWALASAAVVLALPARVTAPLRMVFTEAVGPAQQAAFHAAGEGLAAAGTLRDAMLGAEAGRLAAREAVRQANENALLREKLRTEAGCMVSADSLQVRGFPHRRLSALVTAYDAGATRHSIVIGAGTTDGVGRGMAVCALGAVVGKVAEAGPWRSRVQLLTDPAARLPVRVTTTRELCLLAGDGSASCDVRMLDRESKAARGGVLVTAPVDDVLGRRPLIPPGLPAATIRRTRRGGANALFLQVAAEPRVDVRRLETVVVIVPERPPAPSEDE